MSEYEQPQKRHHNDAQVAHRQRPQPKPKLIGEPYDPWAGKEPRDGLAKNHPGNGHGVDRPATGQSSRATHEGKQAQSGGGSRAAIDPNRGFGEHIVGSTTTETIHMPWNLADHHASARFHISGAGFELLSPLGEVPMPPSASMTANDLAHAVQVSPKIQFAPDRPGAYHGELSVEIRWRDGHVETKTVALHGRARTLEQAPAAYEPASPAAQPQAQPAHVDLKDPKARAIDAAFSEQVRAAMNNAALAARGLATAQKGGVELVEKEQTTYQKQLENVPRSMWWDLVEIALTMATAGASTVVTKMLLSNIIAQSGAKKLGDFATDSMKEGLKLAGKTALKETLPSGTPGQTANGQSEEGALSSNMRIDFFGRQRSVLDKQAGNNEKMVSDFASSLQPLVPNHPEHAVELLNVLADSFVKAANRAQQLQAEASATQWTTAVARATLGTQYVATAKSPPGAAPLTATKTALLRPASSRGVPTPVDGVLDVYIAHASADAQVVGAKLHGVAQEVADRIKTLELANVRIPIRFIVGSWDAQPTIITRDEAGRVRVQDTLGNMGPREEQSIAGAEALIHRVLSVPLMAWGVEVQSDDASGRK